MHAIGHFPKSKFETSVDKNLISVELISRLLKGLKRKPEYVINQLVDYMREAVSIDNFSHALGVLRSLRNLKICDYNLLKTSLETISIKNSTITEILDIAEATTYLGYEDPSRLSPMLMMIDQYHDKEKESETSIESLMAEQLENASPLKQVDILWTLLAEISKSSNLDESQSPTAKEVLLSLETKIKTILEQDMSGISKGNKEGLLKLIQVFDCLAIQHDYEFTEKMKENYLLIKSKFEDNLNNNYLQKYPDQVQWIPNPTPSQVPMSPYFVYSTPTQEDCRHESPLVYLHPLFCSFDRTKPNGLFILHSQTWKLEPATLVYEWQLDPNVTKKLILN